MKFGGFSPDGPPRGLADRLARLLKGGCSRKDACMVCGIHPATLRAWLKKGRFLEGDRNHRYLYEVVTVAEGQAKARMIKRVVSANDWKAAAHFLARRYPDEWGDKKTVAIEDKRLSKMTRPELLRELHEQMQALEEEMIEEGEVLPDLALPPPDEQFTMAEAAGLFDDSDDEDEAEQEHGIPVDEHGRIPTGTRARMRLIAIENPGDGEEA